MPASFLHALPGLVGAWGEIWHGGALELSAFDRLAATARRPGGQKLCRSAIRRSERAGGGPPPARSAQCLQARRRWGAQSDIEKRDDDRHTRRYETIRNPIRDETIFLRSIFLKVPQPAILCSYVVHPRSNASEMASICASVVGQTVLGHSSAGGLSLLLVSSAHVVPRMAQ